MGKMGKFSVYQNNSFLDNNSISLIITVVGSVAYTLPKALEGKQLILYKAVQGKHLKHNHKIAAFAKTNSCFWA